MISGQDKQTLDEQRGWIFPKETIVHWVDPHYKHDITVWRSGFIERQAPQGFVIRTLACQNEDGGLIYGFSLKTAFLPFTFLHLESVHVYESVRGHLTGVLGLLAHEIQEEGTRSKLLESLPIFWSAPCLLDALSDAEFFTLTHLFLEEYQPFPEAYFAFAGDTLDYLLRKSRVARATLLLHHLVVDSTLLLVDVIELLSSHLRYIPVNINITVQTFTCGDPAVREVIITLFWRILSKTAEEEEPNDPFFDPATWPEKAWIALAVYARKVKDLEAARIIKQHDGRSYSEHVRALFQKPERKPRTT